MRAWALISLGDDRQYGGNTGYRDDPTRTYRYDSTVPNHRQLAVGDLVFIRDRTRLIGLAVIENVSSGPSLKVRRRCPECGSVDIKTRRTVNPPWRCVDGHTFGQPNEESIPVVAFEANYGNTYVAAPPNFAVSRLKAAAIRPNDQLAIEEVNPSGLETALTAADPSLIGIFAASEQNNVPAPLDALGEPPEDEANPFVLSAHDTREAVLRAIKARRGQRKFRNSLIRRYGPNCMISGCALMDLIEAAHIWPYRGAHSNNVRNGLLLRADLHTLFDLDLLGIHPATLAIKINPQAIAVGYAAFEGVHLATAGNKKPAREPIEQRWEAFQRRLSQGTASGTG